MATRAEPIDTLMNKGNFEPQVALAIAEAVAVIMTDAQVVTVPVLDARVAELKACMTQLDHKTDLVNVGLETKIERVRMDLEAKIDRVKAELEKRIDSVKTELEKKIEGVKTELEKKIDGVEYRLGKLIESTKSELVRWVLLAMLGSGAIQAGAAAFVNAVQNH